MEPYCLQAYSYRGTCNYVFVFLHKYNKLKVEYPDNPKNENPSQKSEKIHTCSLKCVLSKGKKKDIGHGLSFLVK